MQQREGKTDVTLWSVETEDKMQNVSCEIIIMKYAKNSNEINHFDPLPP